MTPYNYSQNNNRKIYIKIYKFYILLWLSDINSFGHTKMFVYEVSQSPLPRFLGYSRYLLCATYIVQNWLSTMLVYQKGQDGWPINIRGVNE